MNQITEPIQPLLDIDDVAPMNDDDRTCLQDIREVLQKHGRLSRFGISLLHGHFPVADDEILVETCDTENRVLTSKPVKVDSLKGINAIETNWRLDTGAAMSRCTTICLTDGNSHSGKSVHG